MKRPATKIVFAAAAFGVGMIVLAGVRVATRRSASDEVPCGAGFTRLGARCCANVSGDACAAGPAASCPLPLVKTAAGCDVPERSVVDVPATSVLIGPADWEAEGRVRARTVKTERFAIDRFEVSIGQLLALPASPALSTIAARLSGRDAARAASELTLPEARSICAARGGRLPTEDEWIVAAAGAGPRRYPWGDTGAVCRRAAWGLTRGPCGSGATGPDTVGAHPDGASPLGIHDLAGNVAEWVESGTCASPDCVGVVRGGSYATDLATDLRTWVRREAPSAGRDPTIGVRCAYVSVTPP